MLIRRKHPDMNKKKIYRLYREEQLQVRRRRRSKTKWERVPLETPTGPGQIWAIDFIHDRQLNGRKVKILVVIDEYS